MTLNMSLGSSVTGFCGMRIVLLLCIITYLCVSGNDATITCILDLGLEIITMPKWIWEKLGLPIQSDHPMTISLANTSTDATLGVLENLALNFRPREVQ